MLTSPSPGIHKALPQLVMASVVMCVQLASVARATEPPITAVAFAPDGQTVVGVSQSGLQQFSWPQLVRQRIIKVSAANLHCLAFAADGRHLAVGGGNPAEDGVVEVFIWPQGKSIAAFVEHKDSVRSVAWVDSTQIVSASLDRELKLWEFPGSASGSIHGFSGHSRGVSDVLLLNDDETMVTAGDDQSVRVWEVATGKLIRSLNQHTKPIHSLAARPSAGGLPMVASAAGDRTIKFWQPTIGRMVRYVRLDSVPLNIAWIDEDRIAAACVDGRVRIVDANEVRVLQTLDGINGWAYALAVDPVGNSIVVGGNDGQLRNIKLEVATAATE